MSSTEVLREEVRQYIENADERSLRVVKAVFAHEYNDAPGDTEEWDQLPPELQQIITKAEREAEEGKTTPHDEILKQYAKWFRK